MSAKRLLVALAVMSLASPALAEIPVEHTKLGHGVTAWTAPNASVPVVDVLISFEGAGYTGDPAGKEGRASLAAAMLSQGAGNLDALGFQRALEDKAISIEAKPHADRLVIHVHALREQAKAAGELLALALTKPRIDAADLAREKTETITELKLMEESPNYVASIRFEKEAFPGHPYSNPPAGTAESVAGLSAEDLRAYLHDALARDNILVSVAGDVDDSLVSDMLSPVIDGLADHAKLPAIKETSMQGGGSNVMVERNLPQSVVIFAAPGIKRDDPKFYAAYLLNQAIGGNELVSRLASVIRQEKGLVYGVDSELDIRSGATLIRGDLATRAASTAEAIASLKATLGDLAANGITPQECEDARTYILGSFPLQLDSSSAVASSLLMMQLYHLGDDYLAKREGYFKAVTCPEVNEAAHQLLDPKRFIYVTVGSTAKGAAK